MSCALTAGYTGDCLDGIGGAKEAKVIETSNVTAITVASGVVTGITKASAKRFWKYKPARKTLSAKETLNASVENGTGYWDQEVSMSLNKMQTATRTELENLRKNNVYIVVKDANGKNWLYGYKNGLDASAGEAGTGTAEGDRNGYSITFKGAEPESAIEVDDTTYLSLETPGS